MSKQIDDALDDIAAAAKHFRNRSILYPDKVHGLIDLSLRTVQVGSANSEGTPDGVMKTVGYIQGIRTAMTYVMDDQYKVFLDMLEAAQTLIEIKLGRGITTLERARSRAKNVVEILRYG